MADPSLISSVTEMKDKFLEDITCEYELYIADSSMSGAGFGLFAREEVPAGKEVFRVAVPAVSAADANELHGGGIIERSARCTYSYTLIYREINAHARRAKEFSSAIRMLVRLVVLHQHGGLTDNQWQAILSLKSHKALIEESEALDWAAINADIEIVKEVTEDDMSENDLEDLYWRIKFNQHSVDSPMQPRLGSCLVPGAALINHSCCPNAHHLSEGPELVVRSYRKIAKNEEITISYIDPTQCFEERQNALFTAYAFACQCCRCTEGSEEQSKMLTGDPVLDTQTHRARTQLHALLSALVNDDQELGSVEARMREICNDSSGKPWLIYISPIPNIYVTLARRFEEKQQWEKALHHWLKIVYVIDPLRYPDRLNVHRVEDLMLLCQLEGRISQISERDSAIKADFRAIEEALSVVQYGHNTRLKDDAAASLGTNHVIFKTAAHFVEAMDKQMITGMGVTPSVWQSGPVKEMREERLKTKEHELLNWACIDLTAKII